jgi:hypothetical protein
MIPNVMTLLGAINLYLESIIYFGIWNLLEMYAGFFLFLACIFQRATLAIFSTKKSPYLYFAVKLGQIGLYLQMMMGLIASVDGYFCNIEHVSHAFTGLCCLGVCLTKFSVYFKVFLKKDVDFSL